MKLNRYALLVLISVAGLTCGSGRRPAEAQSPVKVFTVRSVVFLAEPTEACPYRTDDVPETFTKLQKGHSYVLDSTAKGFLEKIKEDEPGFTYKCLATATALCTDGGACALHTDAGKDDPWHLGIDDHISMAEGPGGTMGLRMDGAISYTIPGETGNAQMGWNLSRGVESRRTYGHGMLGFSSGTRLLYAFCIIPQTH